MYNNFECININFKKYILFHYYMIFNSIQEIGFFTLNGSIVFGAIGYALICLSYISQLYKTIKCKSSKDISYLSYALMIVCMTSWLMFYYILGFERMTVFYYLPIANIITTIVFALLVIILKFYQENIIKIRILTLETLPT